MMGFQVLHISLSEEQILSFTKPSPQETIFTTVAFANECYSKKSSTLKNQICRCIFWHQMLLFISHSLELRILIMFIKVDAVG